MKLVSWFREAILTLDRHLDRLVLSLSGICLFASLLLTIQQVIARYLFSSGSVAMQELEWHLFAASFILCIGVAYGRDEQVRVDVLSTHMSPRLQRVIEILGILVFLLPFALVLVVYGLSFVEEARSYGQEPHGLVEWLLGGEASPDPGGLRARWILKSMIPLAGGLLCLKSVARLLRLHSIRGGI